MAESRSSLASRGISDHAEGMELINKDLLTMAKFSPDVVNYNFDMAEKEIDETIYREQFGNNTYVVFDGCFPDMTDEEMVEARYEEQFDKNRYEKIATPSLNQPSDPTMLGESEDSSFKLYVPNRDKDECGCSICLGYYLDKSDCGCSICLEYHRDKDECDCSICLGYYRDKNDCGCSICLEYHRDKHDCGCSIYLEYHRDKHDCHCSICLEYYCGTDKAIWRTKDVQSIRQFHFSLGSSRV